MWSFTILFLILASRIQAFFFDWNLHELREPNLTFSMPDNALKVTPLLGDWKKAQAKAVVKPFAGDVKSYAGFFTINGEYDSNMFFWYFPSEKEPKKAPVILWLHGGPGQSSMMGLFEESGPYKIVDGRATLREASWTKHYNVLYLDNPIGAGFSYTSNRNGYSNNIKQAVDNLYEALTQFYKMFPDYKKNDFYVIGQSYGGKYIPVLANLIDKKNSQIKGAKKINLKGMMIGCGCLDPINQIAFGQYLYEYGVIDANDRDETINNEERAKNFLDSGFSLLALAPLAAIAYKMTKSGYPMPLDISDPAIDLTSYDQVEGFVTCQEVRKEIHVGNTTFNDKKVVLWYFAQDLLNSVSTDLAKTLKLGYKVLLYAGQFDMVIPHEQTDRVIENLDWEGVKNFRSAKAEPWYSHKELAGYRKSYRNLHQVFVRKANHMIVRSQQKWMLDLLRNFTG